MAQSRYYRFMYRLDHLSTAMLARFTQIDYDREMALVAVVEAGMVGEVLAHNLKMLALCRGLGFSLRRRVDDADVVAVSRPL